MTFKPLIAASFAILLAGCVEQTAPVQPTATGATPAATSHGACAAPASAAGLLTYVNAERRKAGLGAVTLSAQASAAAQAFACEIAARKDISHTGNDGSNPRTRLERTGISASTVAENTAWGYTEAGKTMAAWMDSPGHRRNLLLPQVTKIGIGQALGAYPTWVLDLYAPY